MVDDLHFRWRFGPWLREKPDSLPQSPTAQQPPQPTHAQPQHADDSLRSAPMVLSQRLRRRPESSGGYPTLIGVFDSAAVGQRPQRRHRQRQPVSGHPLRVVPSGLVPHKAHRLQRSEARLYPEPKSIPAHSRAGDRHIGHHYPGFCLSFVPDHYHSPPTPFARSSERGSRADVGISGTRSQHPRMNTGSSVRTEHRVDRLANVGMPSQRDYLIPQPRASQTTVAHHHHSHLFGNSPGTPRRASPSSA